MTPGARVQAAIEALDEILSGAPAERVLTSWARRSRFAGSKDRAAVRDLVFSGLRQRNSLAARGYLETLKDPGDKRVLMVRYTKRGLGFVATLREVKTEMQAEAEAALGTHKASGLSEDLRRITGLWTRED